MVQFCMKRKQRCSNWAIMSVFHLPYTNCVYNACALLPLLLLTSFSTESFRRPARQLSHQSRTSLFIQNLMPRWDLYPKRGGDLWVGGWDGPWVLVVPDMDYEMIMLETPVWSLFCTMWLLQLIHTGVKQNAIRVLQISPWVKLYRPCVR